MAEPDLTLLTEQERQEGIPGLFTPDELALARAASSMFADQEMMADVYNRIDPDYRPGGKYGTLAGMGAQNVRFKTYLQDKGDPVVTTGDGQVLLGAYFPPQEGYDEVIRDERGSLPPESQVLATQGTEPMRVDEIYMLQRTDRGPEEQTRVAGTLMHEMVHRAAAQPFYKDMIEWAEGQVEQGNLSPSDVDALRMGQTERYADKVGIGARGNPEGRYIPTRDLERIGELIREFMTPERQEMYGVRVPVESEPPIEKGIMDYVRSAVGLAKGGPPKGFMPIDQMDMFLNLLDVVPGPAGKLAKPVAKGIQSLSKGRKAAKKKAPTREQARAKIDGLSAAAAGLASGIMDPELLKAKEEGFDIENVRYRGQHGESPDIETKVGSISFGDAEAASLYAQQPNVSSDVAQASKVFPSFLKIENPIINAPDDPFMDFSILSDAIGFDKAKKYFIKHQDDVMNTGNWEENFMDEYDSVADVPDSRLPELYMQSYTILDDPSAVKDMKAAGFDGAIHMGSGETFDQTEYKVFDKSQIRSIFSPGEAGLASLGPELDKRMAKLKKTLESKKGKPSPDKPVPPEPRRFDDYENPKDRNRR